MTGRATALLLSLGVLLAAHSIEAAAPEHQWSQRFGSFLFDAANGVAVDGSNNVIVTGSFFGTVNFGGGNLTSAGENDIFVAKYDASGAHQWSRRFGGTGGDVGTAVAVDASGNVIVVGYFSGTVDFGGGNLASSGNVDIFAAKFDASGAHQWSQRFGGTSGDFAHAVDVDASDNAVVTGHFADTVDFGGGPLASAGSIDIFVAKYEAGGGHQWSRRFGNTGVDGGADVVADASGNVIVTGQFSGTLDFGGGNLASAGDLDIFVAKFDAGAVHQWSQRFGSADSDDGEAVAVDASGNVIVTGYFSGTADFGGGNLVSGGGKDIFAAKYDANGVHQWSRRFGGATDDFCEAVAADATGNLIVTGSFTGTVDFGGGDLASLGSADIFVAGYSAGGAHQWSKRVGGADNESGLAIARDASGNVIVAGLFNGTVDFGGGSLTSAGFSDIFVAKYAPEDTVTTATVAAPSASLLQNFPNPFNPRTTIEYTVAVKTMVSIEIFDALGTFVARLAEGERRAGTYQAEWDGRDFAGRSVASGVYFYRLAGVRGGETRKMVLLK